MSTKHAMMKTAFGLMMAIAAGGTAAAETAPRTFKTPFSGTLSGMVTNSQIDAVNPGDGVKGILGIFGASSRQLGQSSVETYVEDIPVPVPTNACPSGTDFEFTLGTARSIARFPNGDLLYLKGLTRTLCVDLETATSTIHETGEFTGGTGQFAEAGGSWNVEGTTKLWVVDSTFQFFGPFTSKLWGTLETPTRFRRVK